MNYVRKHKKCTVERSQCNNAQCALQSSLAPCNHPPVPYCAILYFSAIWCKVRLAITVHLGLDDGPGVHSFTITITYYHYTLTSHTTMAYYHYILQMSITVHLGLDDVELVLGSAAEDLHLVLANLLDQRLFKRTVFTTEQLFLCTVSTLERQVVPQGPRHLFQVGWYF